MREFIRLRRLYMPQIVALALVFAVFATSAALAGGGAVSGGAKAKGEGIDVMAFLSQSDYILPSEGAPEKTAQETEAPVTQSAAAAAIENIMRTAAAKNTKPIAAKIAPEPVGFNDSVGSALAKMALTEDAINKWIEQHPNSTLKEVRGMQPAMQKKVANIATFISSVNGKVDKKTAWREAAAIVHYCSKYNISTELAVGVAKVESNFTPTLTSKSGARGVMQVMWKYHADMLRAKGVAAAQEDLHDPEKGVEAGVLLLSRYLDAYETIPKALSRYLGKASESYVKKVDNNVAMLEKHVAKNGF